MLRFRNRNATITMLTALSLSLYAAPSMKVIPLLVLAANTITAYAANSGLPLGGTMLRDIAADILKGLAVDGISKAIKEAVWDGQSLPVDKRPILELTWQVPVLTQEIYHAKLVEGRLGEWGWVRREIGVNMFQGVRMQTFKTVHANHENPTGWESLAPFTPEFIGNFRSYCRELRTGRTEILNKLHCTTTIELYLKAANFNVPVLERGMQCLLVITETEVPAGCPAATAPPERVRQLNANARYNAATVLPGVPASSHALNSLTADPISAWTWH